MTTTTTTESANEQESFIHVAHDDTRCALLYLAVRGPDEIVAISMVLF